MARKSKGPSRMALTVRSLLVMGGVGAALSILASYTQKRDVQTATGPQSSSQEQFFVNAADRPDINTFFQKLTAPQKLAMSTNIGRYQDPVLAKLCGKLLADFDPRARAALTDSLTKIAVAHPEAVAVELKEQGSFQELGVIQALRAVGPGTMPLVAKELTDKDARQNAVDYLGGSGLAAVPLVLPYLQSADADVRIAAAEVLGQVRAKEAVPELTQMMNTATGNEKTDALSAIAEIADPTSEPLLTGILNDQSVPVALRIQAALGLGRIGTTGAAATLWPLAADYDLDLREGIFSALALCSDASLRTAGIQPKLKLQVAKQVQGPLADAVIRVSLGVRTMREAAAAAAGGRESLVGPLVSMLSDPKLASDGSLTERIVDALSTTQTGASRLDEFRKNAWVAGFIIRRKALGAVNPESE